MEDDIKQVKRADYFSENCSTLPELKHLRSGYYNFIHKYSLNTNITFNRVTEEFEMFDSNDNLIQTFPFNTNEIFQII